MKEAGVAPPGVMPIQQPTMQLRIDVTQYCSSFFQVCSTAPRRMLACVPENLRPLSMEERISPMPNRPITAIRKSKPTSSSLVAEGHAQRAGHLVEADRAEREAQAHGGQHLEGRALAHADEAGKRQEEDGEELRRPELQRELGDQRRQEGDQDHGHQGADEGGGEGGRQRLVGPALLGHGVAVEGGGHRPGLARDIEQDGGDGATEQRSPVDAGEHDDGRGRRHREGQGQEDGHAVGPTEAGQDANDDAQQDADHHQGQVVPGQRDLEAANERRNVFHVFPFRVASPHSRLGLIEPLTG